VTSETEDIEIIFLISSLMTSLWEWRHQS